VAHRFAALKVGIGAVVVAMAFGACKSGPTNRPIGMSDVDTGIGSLEATRQTLNGTWTLASLETVDASGAKRPVKATGQLVYDAFGNMMIHATIDDPKLRDAIALDYSGRIVIDVARHEYRAAAVESDRPVEFGQIPALAPDKVRHYELSAKTFVVSYLDAAGKPAAVAHWQR
jgi:hypothetical protein